MVATRRSSSQQSAEGAEAAGGGDDASSAGPLAAARPPETPLRRSGRAVVAKKSPAQTKPKERSKAKQGKAKAAVVVEEEENEAVQGFRPDLDTITEETHVTPETPLSFLGRELEKHAAESIPETIEEQSDESEEDEESLIELMASAVRSHCKSQVEQAGIDRLRWQPVAHLPPKLSTEAMQPDKTEGMQLAGVQYKQLHASQLDERQARREAAKKAPKTKGKGWFDLPAHTLDEEKKRELRLIRLRGAYDPKRFYKSFDTTKLPTYFQIGTVLNGPADRFQGALTKAEGKNTSVTQQLLADTQVHHYRKKRYNRMQDESQRWANPKRHKFNGKAQKERVQKRKPKPKH